MSKTLQHFIERKHVRRIPDDARAELIARVPNCTGTDLAEKLFWVVHEVQEYPCCEACGSSLDSSHWKPFLKHEQRANKSITQGYMRYCGRSCAYKFGTKQESYKKTSLAKFGVDHPMKAPEVVAKIKATNIDRYGHANPNRWTGEKFLNAINEKYGTTTVRHIDGVSEKVAKTKLDQTKELLLAKIAEMEELFEVTCLTPKEDLNTRKIVDLELEWRHACGKEWSSNISFRGIRSCPLCWAGTSKGEQEIAKFIEGFGVAVEQRTKKIIAPKELDIWVPEKKIAIEFDGTYWHSAKFQNEQQSLDKLNTCEGLGIQLITIQEHLWVNRPELVRSRLASIFGSTRKIGARQTKAKVIDSKLAGEFLNDNHLQGNARSAIHLGLFKDDDLVSVATFGRPRWAKKYDWELIRMASKTGLTIQGGPSKLMKFFGEHHEGSLVSYADRCWSTGNVYKQLGFEFSHNAKPSWWWVHHTLGTYSRYQTQKSKIKRLLTDLGKQFYLELSEEDNMRLAGFLPLYDRGNSVWFKNNSIDS